MSDTTVQTLSGPSVGMQAMAPVATTEAYIHAIIGAQFGDLEFDVGKSIRWTQWFVDDVHITDVNLGEQRYWVVNWALTYPQAFHSTTSVNFFTNPASAVQFRKEQFRLAEQHLILEDTDWCLIVDAHEGMSCDSRSLPDDYLIAPFRSFIYREITRAEAAGKDQVIIPFYVFLGHNDVVNIEYWAQDPANPIPVPPGEEPVDTAIQSVGVPYYLTDQGLGRLVKVSRLKDPNFNWSTLDVPTPVTDPTVKVQIVSYGYAHWNEQDIVPPATEPEPLSEANDDGYRMRNLLSRVRPVTSLPYGSPYHPPEDDPDGLVGPWCADMTDAPDVGVREAAYLDGTVGSMISDDTPPLIAPEGFTLVWKTRGPLSDDQTLVSVWDEAGDDRSYKLMGHSDGSFSIWISTDGINETEIALTFNPTFEDDWDYERALSIFPGPLGMETRYNFWSHSGDGWNAGTERGMSGLFTPFSTSVTAKIKVGEDWDSRVYYAEQRTGKTPTSTLQWRFAADEALEETLPTYEDSQLRNWTVSDVDAISPATIAPLPSYEQPPPVDPACEGILVPLYDTVFRINLRDGVWYEGDEKGNIPLMWDVSNQVWVPRGVTPEEWSDPNTFVTQP